MQPNAAWNYLVIEYCF